jgi:hypothetical protein
MIFSLFPKLFLDLGEASEDVDVVDESLWEERWLQYRT